MNEPAVAQKFLVDPYALWLEREGVRVHEGTMLDLNQLATAPWPRFGVDGCVAHVRGRCDFLTVFVFAFNADAQSHTIRHIYDANILVLSGEGTTHYITPAGEHASFRWKQGDAFSLPPNASHSHHCAPTGPARLACISDMRYLMGLYRNDSFIFAHPAGFDERYQKAIDRGLTIDLNALPPAHLTHLTLGDSSIAFDIVTVPAKSKTAPHRQMQGQHILCLGGEAVVLSCDEQQTQFTHTRLMPHQLYGLKAMEFHAFMNPTPTALRVMMMSLGTQSSPIFRSRHYFYGNHAVYASGEAKITAQEESPALQQIWQNLRASTNS